MCCSFCRPSLWLVFFYVSGILSLIFSRFRLQQSIQLYSGSGQPHELFCLRFAVAQSSFPALVHCRCAVMSSLHANRVTICDPVPFRVPAESGELNEQVKVTFILQTATAELDQCKELTTAVCR